MPKLVITSPDGACSELEMRGQPILIGREGEVELILDSIEVSRKHARITQGDKNWKIEDLGSANGTSVNGRTIKGPTELSNKARIEIAGYEIVFEDETSRAGPNPVLIGQGPPVQNKTFILPTGDLEVGRVEGNAIVIADSSISRKHARIRVSAQQVRVEDLGSSNGTRVNGETIKNHLLEPGDEVQFGKVIFDFSYTDNGKSAGPRSGFMSQLNRADRSFKLAAAIGAMSVGLLMASLVVALKRHQPIEPQVNTPSASLHSTFETRISVGLLEAENLETRGEWRASLSSFESVLERDPINQRARDGQMRTRAVLDDQRAIARAKETFEQKQFAAAVRSAERVHASGPLGPEAKDIIQRASKELEIRALKQATNACKRREWRTCQKSAIRAAKLAQDPAKAQELITKAEAALNKAKIVFIPAALLLP